MATSATPGDSKAPVGPPSLGLTPGEQTGKPKKTIEGESTFIPTATLVSGVVLILLAALLAAGVFGKDNWGYAIPIAPCAIMLTIVGLILKCRCGEDKRHSVSSEGRRKLSVEKKPGDKKAEKEGKGSDNSTAGDTKLTGGRKERKASQDGDGEDEDRAGLGLPNKGDGKRATNREAATDAPNLTAAATAASSPASSTAGDNKAGAQTVVATSSQQSKPAAQPSSAKPAADNKAGAPQAPAKKPTAPDGKYKDAAKT